MTELKLQAPGVPGATPQEKKIIRGALVASLLLHVVLVAATWRIPLKPRPEDLIRPDTDREVELILVPDEAAGPDAAEQPKQYVSVPDRQAAEAPPEEPDYLALHHSLAADTKLGDSDKPSADEEGPFEAVQIQKEELTGAGGVEYSPQAQEEKPPSTSRQEAGAEGAEDKASKGEPADPVGDWALPSELTQTGDQTEGQTKDPTDDDKPDLADWWGGRANPSILKEGQQGSVGDRGFDFNQNATGSITSGVAVIDQFQLNTVAWDWAPWIQVFGNELHRHWVPPYAYRYGLIHGTTVIKLVVEKDGRPSSMVVIDQDGHQSLHDASLAALKAFAPYLPLPAAFPEENLVITLSLHYPAFRH